MQLNSCIYIVRHGRTLANAQDKIQGSSDKPILNELDEVGRKEAEELSGKLRKVTFDDVFSSDYRRAIQTCKIVTRFQAPNLIKTDPRIRERDWRLWEGRDVEEFYKTSPWHTIESDESVAARGIEFLDEVADNCNGKTLLVVTHGGWMRCVLIGLLGLKCKVGDIKVQNASYYTLEYCNNTWKLGTARDGVIVPENALRLSNLGVNNRTWPFITLNER